MTGIEWIIVIAIVVIVGGGVVGGVCLPILTRDTVTFTVKDKERVTKGTGDSIKSYYLVYTDSEVFENTDCLVLFKFNSSDVQGQLDKGFTYEADVYGWRIPFFSMYRNIIKVKRASKAAGF